MSGIPANLIVDTKLTCFYFVESYINLWFEIEQMAAILYYMHNTIPNVLSSQTTMSGIPENPIARYQNQESASILNDINLLFDLEHMAAILDFTHNTAMS